MWRQCSIWTVVAILLGTTLSACVTTERTYQGAAAGGAVGATAGLLIDKNNRWRGALLGGALGALLGGTITEVSARASQEAAQQGKTVTYTSEDGAHHVQATPLGYNSRTKCRQVREQVYQEGRLVRDQVKEVCAS